MENAQQYRKVEIKDFSGGITDFPVDTALNKYARADNLQIEEMSGAMKLVQRPGSIAWVETPVQNPDFVDKSVYDFYIIDTPSYGGIAQWVIAFNTYGAFWLHPTLGWLPVDNLQGNTVMYLFMFDKANPRPRGFFYNNKLYVSSGYNGELWNFYYGPLGIVTFKESWVPQLYQGGITTSNTVGSSVYLYKLVWYYTYVINGVTFIERGVSWLKTISNNGQPSASNVTFSGLPTGVTTGRRIEIYRTKANGTYYYKLALLALGATSYTDNTSDTALEAGEPYYAQGGVPEFSRPPRAKFFHMFNTTGIYGYVQEYVNFAFDQPIPGRLYQSVPGVPEAVTLTNYFDVQGIIGGISSYRDYLLVFCSDGPVYSLTGGFDELGAGGYTGVAIDYGAGILNHAAIVQTERGVFWPGADGIYWTDGLSTQKISSGINETYKALTTTTFQKWYLNGRYDPEGNRIYWTVATSQSATEADVLADEFLVLDLKSGISADMAFTIFKGGEMFYAQGLQVWKGKLYRSDARGYIYEHSSEYTSDPATEIDTIPATWGKLPIICSFKSACHDFGDSSVKKWVPTVTTNFKNRSNLSLRVFFENDASGEEIDLKQIENQGAFVWGVTDWLWGDPSFIWNVTQDFFDKRRFHARKLRCFYRQVGFETAFTNIYSSDVSGLAEVNGITGVATINTGTWPVNSVYYEIAFGLDNFVQGYEINFLDTGDTELYFSGASIEEVITADVPWVIRGYRVDQVFHIQNYALEYALFGSTQQAYRKGMLLEDPST